MSVDAKIPAGHGMKKNPAAAGLAVVLIGTVRLTGPCRRDRQRALGQSPV